MMTFSTFEKLILFTAAVGLIAGCNVGPKYARPNVTAPPVYRGADNAAVASDSKDSFEIGRAHV